MENFKQFIVEKRLTGYRAGALDVGIIWLSALPELAGEYAATKDAEVRKYTFELNNPLVIRKAELERSLREFVLEIINNYNGDIDDKTITLAKELIKNKQPKKLFQLWDEHYTKLKQLLINLGYDGIQTTENRNVTYGLFSKKQLK